MKTEIKLSDQIENNIIVDPKEEDLSKHYLSEKIIIVNDFVDEDDLGILRDCQVKNVGWRGFREGDTVLRKIWYMEAIENPRMVSNNPQFGKALRRLRKKILNFAVNKFKLIYYCKRFACQGNAPDATCFFLGYITCVDAEIYIKGKRVVIIHAS